MISEKKELNINAVSELLQKRFAARLKHFRTRKNLTQKAFATKLGLELQTYNRYERKGAQPSLSLLIKMANTLGVTIDKLVGYESNVSNPETDVVAFLQRFEIDCSLINSAPDYVVNEDIVIKIDKSLYYLSYRELVEAIDCTDKYCQRLSDTVYKTAFPHELLNVLRTSYKTISD